MLRRRRAGQTLYDLSYARCFDAVDGKPRTQIFTQERKKQSHWHEIIGPTALRMW